MSSRLGADYAFGDNLAELLVPDSPTLGGRDGNGRHPTSDHDSRERCHASTQKGRGPASRRRLSSRF